MNLLGGQGRWRHAELGRRGQRQPHADAPADRPADRVSVRHGRAVGTGLPELSPGAVRCPRRARDPTPSSCPASSWMPRTTQRGGPLHRLPHRRHGRRHGDCQRRLTTGNVVMCGSRGRRRAGRPPRAAPSAAAPDGGGDFVLTLRGEGVAGPIVDVTITFPATAPAVMIAGARFSMHPVSRDEWDGTAAVTARGQWDRPDPRRGLGGHPFLYEVASRAGRPGKRGAGGRWRRHGRSPLPTGGRWPCGTPKHGSDPRSCRTDRLAVPASGRGAGPVPSANRQPSGRDHRRGAPGPPSTAAPTCRTAV